MKKNLPRTNFILAISAAIPFLATLGFTFYINESKEAFYIVFGICGLLLFLSYICIRRKKKKANANLVINGIEVATAKIPESFIAYVLPLLFAGTNEYNTQLIIFCSCLYLFLLMVSNTVYPSVIFPLLGYKLYKVTTENGVTGLLLAKSNVFNLINSEIKVVDIDDCCFLEVKK